MWWCFSGFVYRTKKHLIFYVSTNEEMFISSLLCLARMVWEFISRNHHLDVTGTTVSGRAFREVLDYESEKYSPDTEINIWHHLLPLKSFEGEMSIRRFTVDHFRNPVAEAYPDQIVRFLGAGIRDDSSLVYLGKVWAPLNSQRSNMEQYFFHNDCPRSFHFGHISGPGWPLNHPPILDDRLLVHARELIVVKPGLKKSLEACLEHLTRPGPSYTGNSEDGVEVSILRK